MCNKRGKIEKKNTYDCNNFSKVKRKYQFEIKLKAIKNKKDIFRYFFSYIKAQTCLYGLIFIILL